MFSWFKYLELKSASVSIWQEFERLYNMENNLAVPIVVNIDELNDRLLDVGMTIMCEC